MIYYKHIVPGFTNGRGIIHLNIIDDSFYTDEKEKESICI